MKVKVSRLNEIKSISQLSECPAAPTEHYKLNVDINTCTKFRGEKAVKMSCCLSLNVFP